MKAAISWEEKRAARLQAVLLRDQRRAEEVAKDLTRPKDLRITIDLVARFVAASGASPRWKRKMERHLLFFWREALKKKSLRNLPRATIAEMLDGRPNQRERFDVLKAFFVFLEETGVMDPAENSFSGLALEDLLISANLAPKISG